MERLEHVAAYAVAAGANGRPDGGDDVLWSGSKSRGESADRARGGACARASPAGVDSSHRAVSAVRQQNRNAIGRANNHDVVWLTRKEDVCLRSAPARWRRGRDVDCGAVHLRGIVNALRRNAKMGCDSAGAKRQAVFGPGDERPRRKEVRRNVDERLTDKDRTRRTLLESETAVTLF